MRNSVILLIFITLLAAAFLSCNKEKQYNVQGKVVNEVTGEPIEGALVHLRDAVGSNALIDGPEVNNIDEDYTDASGDFKVQIKTKDGHGVLYAFKEGYRWIHPTNGSEEVFTGVKQGHSIMILELGGRAYFKPYLLKTSGAMSSADSMYFTNLDYDHGLKTKLFTGTGLFQRYTSLEKGLTVKGDKYLRYKIEFTEGNTWNEKIDSVFLPTSLDVFTDTLTY